MQGHPGQYGETFSHNKQEEIGKEEEAGEGKSRPGLQGCLPSPSRDDVWCVHCVWRPQAEVTIAIISPPYSLRQGLSTKPKALDMATGWPACFMDPISAF